MASVTLQGLSKNFGSVAALASLDLAIANGEFLTLLGPSGCGKSTALACIAGLERPSAGAVMFDAQPVTDLEPHQRNVAMVFQDYALYPHMTVRENMSFGLRQHRLDRETSGLMIFAKNEPAKVALQEGWDTVEKKYFAVIEGAPPGDAGKFDSHLDESNPLKVYPAKEEGPETRHAITHYRVTKKGSATTLVELTLETGRRHQIRVQLAEAGCPIVGDKKYGAQTNPIKRIALHATSLRFLHPVTREEMRFDSPLPGDLGRLV